MNERIAILSNNARGIIHFRAPLISAMIKIGLKVFAFAPDYTENTKKQVLELGAIPVSFIMNRTGTNPFKELFVILRLTRLFRSLKVDICFGFMTKMVVYGSIAAFFAGVKQRFGMIEGLGYYFVDDKYGKNLRKSLIRFLITLLYRISLPLNKAVLLLNPDDANELIARGVFDKKKAVVLEGGIGIDTEKFAPEPIDSEIVTFLFIGRLIKEKGVREFAAAAHKIKQRYPNTRFLIVGGVDTNPGAITEAEVQDWVRHGDVEWLGLVPDVKPLIKSASVYVLPSFYREGMPRTILEAMAMGRPIITTDALGCRETVARLNSGERQNQACSSGIIEGKNGFLIPVRDVDALISAMERFIKEPELIHQMGKESRRLAEERFDVRTVNAKILKAMGIDNDVRK